MEAPTKINEMADLSRESRENRYDSRPQIKPSMFLISYSWHIQAPQEYR